MLGLAFLPPLSSLGFAQSGSRASSGAVEGSGVVPIPPSERGLRTLEAETYFKVSDEPLVLEGAVFDREGSLLFVDAGSGRAFRLSPDRNLAVVVPASELGASGLAIHEDGRIFIAAVGDGQNGSVRAVNRDGSGMRTIVPAAAGYLPNDLAFDDRGGLYFSDSRGSSTEPRGGVYYLSPDGQAVSPVLPNLAIGNGLALSPDGKALWAVEYGRNVLHRVRLVDATTVAPFGATVAYHFQGPAADTVRVDSEGNVYVAMNGQGRVLVFNRHGLPIGQMLIPGRDEGRNLRSTSLAIRPCTNELPHRDKQQG